MKVFAGKTDTAKTIGTPRTGRTFGQIGALCAVLTIDAMLTHDERLAVFAL